jgi:TolB-like protein/Tfp pilus assembly protein PilF
LPFENLGKSDDAYFAAGMTDEISTKLAALGGLTVIGRQSAKSYANTTKPAQQIGKELGATYLLTGTVRWDRSPSGRRLVKITPVLQRASTGAEIWSAPYESEATGVFEIQGKVAEHVAEAMRVSLSQDDKQTLTARPTNNTEAYDYYLRGKSQILATARPEDFNRAVVFLQRAVQLDPKFALARALLAVVHLNIYWFRIDDSPHRLEIAKAAIDTALALDPKLAAGHAAMAAYYYRAKLDYQRALDALVVAERLAPNDADTYDLKALVERRQNRYAESISDEERASRLDPRNPDILANLCNTLFLTRRFDAAEKACRQVVAIAPDKFAGYVSLAVVIISRSGDVKSALAIIRQAESRVDPEEFREGLLPVSWPAVLDPHLASEMEAADPPAESRVNLDYLSGRLYLRVYEKDMRAARQLADSILSLGPRAMRGNFFDSDVHRALALAYAAKGDKQRSSAEAALSMKTTPLSVDAIRAANNVVNLAYSSVLAGSYDEAISYLKQALAIPSGLSVAYLRADPWLDPIRQDPRFKQLVSGP